MDIISRKENGRNRRINKAKRMTEEWSAGMRRESKKRLFHKEILKRLKNYGMWKKWRVIF